MVVRLELLSMQFFRGTGLQPYTAQYHTKQAILYLLQCIVSGIPAVLTTKSCCYYGTIVILHDAIVASYSMVQSSCMGCDTILHDTIVAL